MLQSSAGARAEAGEGGGIVVPGVNYKDKAEQRAGGGGREKGKGNTSRNLAKCFGRNLCAAHANICRGRRAGEREKGQAVGPSIDRWMVASI